MAPVRTGDGGVALHAELGSIRVDQHQGVAADLARSGVPGDNPVDPVAAPGPRSLEILQPGEIEVLVLECEVAHRGVVDGRGDVDQVAEQIVGVRRAEPFESIVG